MPRKGIVRVKWCNVRSNKILPHNIAIRVMVYEGNIGHISELAGERNIEERVDLSLERLRRP